MVPFSIILVGEFCVTIYTFLHIITGIMLFQLDSSRISHDKCSSNTS